MDNDDGEDNDNDNDDNNNHWHAATTHICPNLLMETNASYLVFAAFFQPWRTNPSTMLKNDALARSTLLEMETNAHLPLMMILLFRNCVYLFALPSKKT